uniref:Uncharacterized protein n=1 Tax=Alexandrium andersonii TaxID=327968 RepID=A0A7S2B992_9DINO
MTALEKMEEGVCRSRSSTRPLPLHPDVSFGGGSRRPSSCSPLVGHSPSRDEVERLEQQVGRAEGLLEALTSELRIMGERLQLPSPEPPPPLPQPSAPSVVLQAGRTLTLPCSLADNSDFVGELSADLSAQLCNTPPAAMPMQHPDQLGVDILPNIPRLPTESSEEFTRHWRPMQPVVEEEMRRSGCMDPG